MWLAILLEEWYSSVMGDKHLSITISTGTLIKIGLFMLAALFVFKLTGLVLVVLTAVVIATVIEPGTQWFVKRKIPRVLAAIFMYVLIAGCIISIFTFIVPPLLGQTIAALQNLPEHIRTIDILKPVHKDAFVSVKTFFPNLPNSISVEDLIGNITKTVSEFSGGIFDTVAGFFGGIISFVLVVVISFYLSVREDGVGEFLAIVTPIENEKYIRGLWKRTQLKIGRWMQGQLLLAIVVCVLTYVSLLIIGVSHPLLLAFFAAIFELIPVIGLTLSAIPAFLIAVLDQGIGLGLIVIAVYLFIQQIEAHVIYPIAVKKIVGVPPLLVIISLVAGAELAGFIGALLSVPISVALMEYLDDVDKKKRNAIVNIATPVHQTHSHVDHTRE